MRRAGSEALIRASRVIAWLSHDAPFPPLERALSHPNGLLAASESLSPKRLLEAYSRGIFPWFSEGQPVLWWSPDPRMVLYIDQFKRSRSLAKTMRNRGFEVSIDTAFVEVMRGCAAPRVGQTGTWISPLLIEAYTALHRRGYAHSFETWQAGRLVGGLYGVAIGRMFYGESMFSLVRDASKVALSRLIDELARRGFPVIDCQQETPHLASLGARPLPRPEFAHLVAALIHSNAPVGPWTA